MNEVAAQGGYRIAPMIVIPNSPPPTDKDWEKAFDLDLQIRKKKFEVAPAWQIGTGHPLAMGFMRGDDPAVPSGVCAPPCRDVLKFLSKSASRTT